MKKGYFYSVFLMLTCMLAFCERAHELPRITINKSEPNVVIVTSKLSHQLGNATHFF